MLDGHLSSKLPEAPEAFPSAIGRLDDLPAGQQDVDDLAVGAAGDRFGGEASRHDGVEALELGEAPAGVFASVKEAVPRLHENYSAVRHADDAVGRDRLAGAAAKFDPEGGREGKAGQEDQR